MNRMLNTLGFKYNVTDIASSNMCIIIGLDKYNSYYDYNHYDHEYIWETKILKSVWFHI